MNEPEQFEIDFTRPISPWADTEREEAKRWTPEALCILWVCGGRDDREWWGALPEYERQTWRSRYATERAAADAHRRPMKSPGIVLMALEEAHRESKGLAERWAEDIRKAFLEGKPCPIKPAPRYEWILDWALNLAQINPKCLAMAQQ
jgi:hypothetical protein